MAWLMNIDETLRSLEEESADKDERLPGEVAADAPDNHLQEKKRSCDGGGQSGSEGESCSRINWTAT